MERLSRTFVGQLRRYHRRLRQIEWESVTTTLWMAGGSHCPDLTPAQLQYHLRGHWAIENGVFYVSPTGRNENSD